MLQKTAYGVRRLCRVLGFSESAYYEHRRREGGPSAADEADAHEAHQAWVTWADHRRVYGARRLTSELRHRVHPWNRKKVVQLIMRLSGIEGAHQRRRGTYGKRSPPQRPRPRILSSDSSPPRRRTSSGPPTSGI